MKNKFYIARKIGSINEQGLKVGIRIFKMPDRYYFPLEGGEGPFADLSELKKISLIFNQLLSSDPKRAQQILEGKNIIEVTDLIFSKKGFSVPSKFIELIEHATKGSVKKGIVSGVHFYNPKRVKILKIIDQNNINGVFEAEILFYDKKSKNWIRKNKTTTFFPRTWTMHQLFHECYYALKYKEKNHFKKNVYNSKTISNVPVEIIIINNKFKSIYPLVEYD